MRKRLIYPVSQGATFEGETNDCTVRALANARGMPYTEARSVLAKHGRRRGRGAVSKVWHPAYTECGMVLQGVYGSTSRARFMGNMLNVTPGPGVTLASIMPRLSSGRYIVMITGHAVAVVDGQLIDQGPCMSGSRVFAVYKAR